MATPLKATGTGADAAITIAALGPLMFAEIEFLSWSYDSTPAAGAGLKIESPSGSTLFYLDITVAGPGFIPFSGTCLRGAANSAMIITLLSGAGSVVGKLNVQQRG